MRVAKPKPLQDFILAPGNRIDLDLVIPKHAAGSRLRILDNFSRTVAVLATVAVDPDGIVDSPRFNPPRADHFPDWSQAEQAPIEYAPRSGPFRWIRYYDRRVLRNVRAGRIPSPARG